MKKYIYYCICHSIYGSRRFFFATDKVENFGARGPGPANGPGRGASALFRGITEESTRIPLVRHKPCPRGSPGAVGPGETGRREREREKTEERRGKSPHYTLLSRHPTGVPPEAPSG